MPQLDEWDDQPELFVADDEDDASAPYNTRTAGYDLVGVSSLSLFLGEPS
jgi:hypothetical protein